LSFSYESDDFDLLEIKDRLDKYYMEELTYTNLQSTFVNLVKFFVVYFGFYSNHKQNRVNETITLKEFYKLNETILSKSIYDAELPIEHFDYYYDSSYRFFTFNGAWDACSNRRDRMERESSEFFNNYYRLCFNKLLKFD